VQPGIVKVVHQLHEMGNTYVARLRLWLWLQLLAASGSVSVATYVQYICRCAEVQKCRG
jgi:hypothetical protein